MDGSPPGSSVHGILQPRILEWVPFPSSGYLPDPGIEPTSSTLAGGFLILSYQRSPCYRPLQKLTWYSADLSVLHHVWPIPSDVSIMKRRTIICLISPLSPWKGKRKVKSLSHVQLFATPWTATYQAPLSMGLSRQGYWSGLPFPSPEDLPDPGIEPGSPTLHTNALPSEPPGKTYLHNAWHIMGAQ